MINSSIYILNPFAALSNSLPAEFFDPAFRESNGSIVQPSTSQTKQTEVKVIPLAADYQSSDEEGGKDCFNWFLHFYWHRVSCVAMVPIISFFFLFTEHSNATLSICIFQDNRIDIPNISASPCREKNNQLLKYALCKGKLRFLLLLLLLLAKPAKSMR